MRTCLSIALALAASCAAADVVVATRTLRPQTVIEPMHVTKKSGDLPGTFQKPEDVIGLETRIAIYAGRPIGLEDLGPPATVERNQVVSLIYRQGGLEITTDGRSLGRGATGEHIRVMNLSSRTTLSGKIREDGAIEVQ